jgi:hypothetical protein
MNESTHIKVDPALQAEFSQEPDAALSSLPDKYRLPIVLFHMEGASIEEASRNLNLKPSTLRTRLERARILLRKTLSRRGFELASSGMLMALLATETKAASLSSSAISDIAHAAMGDGAALGPKVQALADGIGRISFGSSGSLATSLTFFMKTKTSIIAAPIIGLAALFTTTKLISEKSTASTASGQAGNNARHAHRTPLAARSGRLQPGSRRKDGARKLRGPGAAASGSLWSLRDLRKGII